MNGSGTVAVIDHGKTNLRVVVVDGEGRILESRSTPNVVRDGPPWRHHDLAGLSHWAFGALAEVASRHPVAAIVPAGHGSGGVLVGSDPDAGGDGAVLPVPDYEEPFPSALDAAFRLVAGPFADRGSAVMMGSTHQARQLFRMEAEFPRTVAAAAHYLSVPQWWAWRLSGAAVSEFSTLGAQSFFWNVPGSRWSGMVERMGWQRLLPAPVASWTVLGPVRKSLALRYGIPAVPVLAGGHDSSLNFYRYQAAGLPDFTLVSTGTWIVAMRGGQVLSRLDESRGMTINSDPGGQPVGGALNMGGRAFGILAGPDGAAAAADADAIRRLVGQGTMALPSFTDDPGQFRDSGGRGRVIGPPPAGAAERRALATLHVALLTVGAARALGEDGPVVLDGTFLGDPIYAPLVAALSDGREVVASREAGGVAAGAALLAGAAGRRKPVEVALDRVRPLDVDGLADYARNWREAAPGRAGAGAGAAE